MTSHSGPAAGASFALRAMLALVLVGLAPRAASAQAAGAIIEGLFGYAGFVEETFIDHTIFGGGARVFVAPRVAIGPEVVYMRGPDRDSDLYVTGNVSVDLLGERGMRRGIMPFLVAGAGLFHHHDQYESGVSATKFGATLGGGARLAVGERFFIAPEFRVGWEQHVRVSVAFGTR